MAWKAPPTIIKKIAMAAAAQERRNATMLGMSDNDSFWSAVRVHDEICEPYEKE